MAVTLTIERREPDARLWLCVEDGAASRQIACFVSIEAAGLFRDALNAARAVAHAQGMSGI